MQKKKDKIIVDDGKISTAAMIEWQKLKDAPFKEKFAYFWDYYRVHTIGSIVIIAIIFSIINTTIINPPFKSAFTLAFYGTYLEVENFTSLTDELNGLMIGEGERYDTRLENYYASDNDPQTTMAMWSKFTAMMASRDISVVIAKKADFEALAAQGMFIPLDEFFEEDDYNKISSKIVKANEVLTKEGTYDEYYLGESKPYGLKIGESEFFARHGFTDAISDYIIGVLNYQSPREKDKPVLEKHFNNSMLFLEHCIDELKD